MFSSNHQGHVSSTQSQPSGTTQTTFANYVPAPSFAAHHNQGNHHNPHYPNHHHASVAQYSVFPPPVDVHVAHYDPHQPHHHHDSCCNTI